jgi:hypothetical protein
MYASHKKSIYTCTCNENGLLAFVTIYILLCNVLNLSRVLLQVNMYKQNKNSINFYVSEQYFYYNNPVRIHKCMYTLHVSLLITKFMLYNIQLYNTYFRKGLTTLTVMCIVYNTMIYVIYVYIRLPIKVMYTHPTVNNITYNK